MADRLSVGGLFSGIGGWELGLERAGMDIAWHCEADPFCQRVLERHWPGVPCFGDVKTLTAGMAEGVDVLCGGFPWQDISLAGKGAGIRGTRSGLWSEYARLIGEFEPRWVLVENVSALLGRGLSVVLADLSALGYDAEWDCVPASAVGAPHQRDRVWIVAYPKRDDLRQQSDGVAERETASFLRVDGRRRRVADADCDHGRPGGARRPTSSGSREREPERPLQGSDANRAGPQGWPVSVSKRQEVAGSRDSGALADSDDLGRKRAGETWLGRSGDPDRRTGIGSLSDTDRKQHEGSSHAFGRSPSEELRDHWSIEPDVGRVAHGVPSRVDRLHALGNALVPQIAEWIGRRIVAYEADR